MHLQAPQSEADAVPLTCRKKGEEEIDPEQARKDLERLEMTRKKRCVSTTCCTAPPWTLVLTVLQRLPCDCVGRFCACAYA